MPFQPRRHRALHGKDEEEEDEDEMSSDMESSDSDSDSGSIDSYQEDLSNQEAYLEEKESLQLQQEEETYDEDGYGNFYGTGVDLPLDPTAPITNPAQQLEECLKRPQSQVRVRVDDWSPKNTVSFPNCTFPFVYKRKIYYQCTNVDSPNKGAFWCANSCHFGEGSNILYRGECDIPRNDVMLENDLLGGLNAINVFVAFLMAVGFTALFAMCFWEFCCCWKSRRVNQQVAEGDEEEGGETQKMTLG